MTSRLGRRLVLVGPLLTAVGLVLSVVVTLRSKTVPPAEQFIPSDAAFLAPYLAAAAMGAIIVLRKSRHVVGWMLFGYGVIGGVSGIVFALAVRLADSGMMTAAAWTESLSVAGVSAAFVLMPASLLRFPNGVPLTDRWQRLDWAAIGAAVIGFFAALVNGGFGGDVATSFYGPSPLRDALGGLADLMIAPFFFLVVLSAAGSVLSLIIRFRRAAGDERRQLQWVGAAAAFLVLAMLATAVSEGTGTASGWNELLIGTGLTMIPVAMAVAILKYRLYEIDIVINRSLTFGTLVAFIGGVYIAIVVGLGEVLGGKSGFGLSIVASVLVAMAFQPMRRRVEHWANRLVYGERATPYEVLVRFSRRSAELSDEDLLDRIPRLIVDGTGASQAALWVRSGDGFRTAATWPEDLAARRLDGDDLADPEADYSLPVFHDGELLGGLSLIKAGGDTVTPPEQALLADLAAGLGLALRNASLTSHLRAQVASLEASRERVLAAADAARRALENDLDSGPQQQLVALKVKLGPTRKRAEQLGAEKTAGLLTQLENDAGEAIQGVRDFAGGIYPPLLEAEGLAVAITQQANKAAIPISVHGDGVRRYSRETEAAVYFTVLEALQNTAKYAGAKSASVTLAANGHRLLFEVRDDGQGFDPATTSAGAGLAGMTDRLDTVGGEVRVESTPGSGTVVTGSVPVAELASG